MAAVATALGVLSALASAGGALMGAQRNKQNERDLLAQRSDLDRELYTGALDSVGAQAYLKEARRVNEHNLQAIDNGIAAGGYTAENALAAKQRLNESYDSDVANLLQQKEANRRGYFRDRMYLNNQINNQRAQQAQNWMTLASNVAGAASNLGQAYLDNGDKLLPESTPATTDADAAAKAAATAQVQPQPAEAPAAPAAPAEPQVKSELVKFNPDEETEEERLRKLVGANGGR